MNDNLNLEMYCRGIEEGVALYHAYRGYTSPSALQISLRSLKNSDRRIARQTSV